MARAPETHPALWVRRRPRARAGSGGGRGFIALAGMARAIHAPPYGAGHAGHGAGAPPTTHSRCARADGALAEEHGHSLRLPQGGVRGDRPPYSGRTSRCAFCLCPPRAVGSVGNAHRFPTCEIRQRVFDTFHSPLSLGSDESLRPARHGSFVIGAGCISPGRKRRAPTARANPEGGPRQGVRDGGPQWGRAAPTKARGAQPHTLIGRATRPHRTRPCPKPRRDAQAKPSTRMDRFHRPAERSGARRRSLARSAVAHF